MRQAAPAAAAASPCAATGRSRGALGTGRRRRLLVRPGAERAAHWVCPELNLVVQNFDSAAADLGSPSRKEPSSTRGDGAARTRRSSRRAGSKFSNTTSQ